MATQKLDWLRLYTEAREDAKLNALSDAQHRVWFNLLCLSGEQDERGVIEGQGRFVLAVKCARGDEALLDETLALLVRLEIVAVDGDVVRFVNFAKRHEAAKPSDRPEATAERKRRSRDVEQVDAPIDSESRDVTPGHAESRDVTPGHALEREREREGEEEGDGERALVAKSVGREGAPRAETRPHPPPIRALPMVPNAPYAVFQAFCEELGVEEANVKTAWKSRQLGIAKLIVGEGHEEADVRGFLRHAMTDPYWVGKAIDLRMVHGQIGTWVALGRPKAVPPKNGRAPTQADHNRGGQGRVVL